MKNLPKFIFLLIRQNHNFFKFSCILEYLLQQAHTFLDQGKELKESHKEQQ